MFRLSRLFDSGARLSGPPVQALDLERYLGRWYEIARLDHSFERGLSNVTAEYSKRTDGGIDVVNRGYSAQQGRWRQAAGCAYFAGEPGLGHLKVSFFGPFFGSYLVLDLDREHYRWALVGGPGTSYLWILARSPYLEVPVLERLLARAAELGYDTKGLIRVQHDRPD